MKQTNRSFLTFLALFILTALSTACMLHFIAELNNVLSFICLIVQGLLCILLGVVIGHSK